jgi:tRNA pseudouridine13 synthase
VARELAKLCGCRPRDIGYAGLKDRHALALQWFTVPRSRLSPEAWREVKQPEFDVLEAAAHSRKLPRGALAGNRFAIRIRDIDPAALGSALANRLTLIARRGVPNYFGIQRFGRQGANLERIANDLSTLRPPERGFVLSAARSLIFNALLAQRVKDGSWDRLQEGDIANLDGRGSVFPVDSIDSTLMTRCEGLDIHPTGPLWGRGTLATQGPIGELETRVAAEFQQACSLVVDAGMEQERRALRLVVRDLAWDSEPNTIVLRFRLTRGSFATTVLREIVASDASGEEGKQ